MIHFFVTFGKNAEESPLGRELRRESIRFRIFSDYVRKGFRNKILMVAAMYPTLLAFGIKSSIKSLITSKEKPDCAVLGNDVEVLSYKLVKTIAMNRKTKICFLGFIYTGKADGGISNIKRTYYSFVLSMCDIIICHSRLETERYKDIFPDVADRFAFVPWGGDVQGWRDFQLPPPAPADQPFRILSAGRSGRDYPTLAAALKDEDVAISIICDNAEAIAGVATAGNIKILRACYGADYIKEIKDSDIVVVPLSVTDISAGQMVIIQAMAYGKPVVVTNTPTISDYIVDGENGLLVRHRDPDDLRAKVLALRDDPLLRARLAAGARQTYETQFSQRAHVRHIVRAITQ